MSTLGARGLRLALGGRPVLDGVDLALAAGEVTALVGPNGAGKSTLMGCLAGLRRADAGEAVLDDAPLLRMDARARARAIAWLPQTPEVGWPMDVAALVALGRTPFIGARGLGAADRAAVARAMAAAGVGPLAARDATTLSGGERARVLLARALAGEPRWLLADEPLAGLDPGHGLDAEALLRRVAAAGAGVLVTVHDLQAALRMADRVVVLAAGRVLADGPPGRALAPDVLERAYGVRARVGAGEAGPLIEVLGRA